MDDDPSSPAMVEASEEIGVALSRPARVRKRNRQFDKDFVGSEHIGKRKKEESTPSSSSTATEGALVTRAKTRSVLTTEGSKSEQGSSSRKKPSQEPRNQKSAKKKPKNVTQRRSKRLETEKGHENAGNMDTSRRKEAGDVQRTSGEDASDAQVSIHEDVAEVDINGVKVHDKCNLLSPVVVKTAEEKPDNADDKATAVRRSARKAGPARRFVDSDFVSPMKISVSSRAGEEDGKNSTKKPSTAGKKSTKSKAPPPLPRIAENSEPKSSSALGSILEESETDSVLPGGTSVPEGVEDQLEVPLRDVVLKESAELDLVERCENSKLDAESVLEQLEQLLGSPLREPAEVEADDLRKSEGNSAEVDLNVPASVEAGTEVIHERATSRTPEPRNENLTNSAEELSPAPSLFSSPMSIPSLTAALNKKSVSIKKRSARKRKRAFNAVAAAEAARKRAAVITKHFRNFLKLPKAHRWISYEFFYSHVDESIFLHENDFLTCVKESFPKLKDTKLTRMEWNHVRRTLGRPRRCSEAFFAQERQTLERKREKVRLIQSCRVYPEFGDEYVPERIPIPLSIGMRVTAKLTRPLNGLFDGLLQAVNTHENTFRIKFDRPDVGSQTVPDFDVAPVQRGLLLPIGQYLGKVRRPTNASATVLPPFSPLKTPSKSFHHPNDQSPSTSPANEHFDGGLPAVDIPLKARLLEGNLSQFPLQSLVNIVRVKKLLDTKNQKLDQLKDFNRQAEMSRAQGKTYTLAFQRKYASLILDLETLNADLNMVLKDVNEYCREVAPEQFPKSFSLLKDVTEQQSRALVWTSYVQINSDGSQGDAGPSSQPEIGQESQSAANERVVFLVTKILALLLQIKSFPDSGAEWNMYDLRALTDTLAEAKASMYPSNRAVFEAGVEVQIRQVLAAMSNSKQAMTGIEGMLRPQDDVILENS